IIKVERSEVKSFVVGTRGGRGGGRGGGNVGRGGGRGSAGPPPREGDWICGSCQKNNFAVRQECFICHAPRPPGAGGFGGGNMRGGSNAGGHGPGRHGSIGGDRGGS